MTGYVIFAIGCFVGAMLGILIIGLCVIARDADDTIIYRPVNPKDLEDFKEIVSGAADANKPAK